jgi:hypothetical protein
MAEDYKSDVEYIRGQDVIEYVTCERIRYKESLGGVTR